MQVCENKELISTVSLAFSFARHRRQLLLVPHFHLDQPFLEASPHIAALDYLRDGEVAFVLGDRMLRLLARRNH